VNSLWIHHLFSEFIMNSISVSRINYFFGIWLGILIFFGNRLWIHFWIKISYGIHSTMNSFELNRFFHREFALNILSAPRFNYYFTIWIHYWNSWYVLRIGFKSGIVFDSSLWIDSFSQILYIFTTCFSNSPWIFYLFPEFTMISLSFLQIRHGFTI